MISSYCSDTTKSSVTGHRGKKVFFFIRLKSKENFSAISARNFPKKMKSWSYWYSTKKGSKMVVADALSRRADWSTGLEHDKEDVVALPESLWIKIVDTELQDAVAAAQKEDNLVQDAVSTLSEPSVSPQHWTIETSGPDSSTRLLFYNGRLYIPDDLDL